MNRLRNYNVEENTTLRVLLEGTEYPQKAIYSRMVEGSLTKINGYIEIEVLDVLPEQQLVKLKFHTDLIGFTKGEEVWYDFFNCDRFKFITEYQ